MDAYYNPQDADRIPKKIKVYDMVKALEAYKEIKKIKNTSNSDNSNLKPIRNHG